MGLNLENRWQTRERARDRERRRETREPERDERAETPPVRDPPTVLRVVEMSSAVAEKLFQKLLEKFEQAENQAERREKLLEHMTKLLETSNKTAEHAAHKLSNMEHRQCSSQGEGNDASRFLHQWTQAETASFPRQMTSQLWTSIKHAESTSALSQSFLFEEKDKRRIESLTAHVHEEWDAEPSRSDSNLYEHTNRYARLIPSVRKLFEIEAKRDNHEECFREVFGKVPRSLEILHQLAEPIDQSRMVVENRKDLSNDKAMELLSELAPLKPSMANFFKEHLNTSSGKPIRTQVIIQR